jgi:hypothetical protein
MSTNSETRKPLRAVPANPASTLDYLYQESRRIFLMGILQYQFQHQEQVHHVRLDYSQPIPCWDGGADVWGHRWQPVWPTLVRFIVEHRLDAATLVQAQYEATEPGSLPSPTEFGPKVLEHYHRAKTDAVQELGPGLKRQYESVRFRIDELRRVQRFTEEDLILSALYGMMAVDATPLFRYCLAKHSGFEEVAGHFEQAALGQYVFKLDDYDQASGEVIPDALRNQTATLLQELRRRQLT